MPQDAAHHRQFSSVRPLPPPPVSLIIRLPNGAVLTPTDFAGRTLGQAMISAGVALRGHDRSQADCDTCHVRLTDAWARRIFPPNQDAVRPAVAFDALPPTPRLSCQTVLTPKLDGLEFSVDAACLEPQTYWVAG